MASPWFLSLYLAPKPRLWGSLRRGFYLLKIQLLRGKSLQFLLLPFYFLLSSAACGSLKQAREAAPQF